MDSQRLHCWAFTDEPTLSLSLADKTFDLNSVRFLWVNSISKEEAHATGKKNWGFVTYEGQFDPCCRNMKSDPKNV